jgi:hypothetical protein
VKTIAAVVGIVLGLSGAVLHTWGTQMLAAVTGAQKTVVYVTPEPDDFGPAKAPVGARIGGQPGGVARGYWKYTGYSDGSVDREWINFPFDWVP